MQKFFTDKPKLFECNIAIDGANINETKARLVLEFPNKRNLLFYGDINKNGKCEVLIPALKEMAECEGTVLLEVIAESTYFESWKDSFKLEQNKKVVVEVTSSEKEVIKEEKIKPIISVISESFEEEVKDDTFENFKKYIIENKININTIIKDKTKFFDLLREYKEYGDIDNDNIVSIVSTLKENKKTNGKIVLL